MGMSDHRTSRLPDGSEQHYTAILNDSGRRLTRRSIQRITTRHTKELLWQ
jgi:hypothetical protein